MFKKEKRLRKSYEYQAVFDCKQFFVTSHLVLYFQPADSLKVGFVVGRKVGGSVIRNRVKRQLREIVRCTDIRAAHAIFLARKGLDKLEFDAISVSVNRLLREANMLV